MPGFLYRMYFKRFRLNCLLLGESSFPTLLFTFLFDWRALSWKWHGTCLARPVCVENDMEHPSKIHLKGFTPMCDSKCFVSQLIEQLGRLKTLQSCQRQTNTSHDFIGSTWFSWAWLASSSNSQAVKSQSIHLHEKPSDFLPSPCNLKIY